MNSTHALKEGLRFVGPAKTLNDAHFLFFSGLSGDSHPIHNDVEYAKRTRFGKPIAHGLLLASLTALGASELKDKVDGFVICEQGCRYLHPAVVGDTLRPEFLVERTWQEGHRMFCRIKTALKNQRGETVLEGFHVYRVIPLKTEEKIHHAG